jgi:hypothetical protein
MSTFKCLVAVVGWLVAAQPSFADDREKVIGIWKLVLKKSKFKPAGRKNPSWNVPQRDTQFSRLRVG